MPQIPAPGATALSSGDNGTAPQIHTAECSGTSADIQTAFSAVWDGTLTVTGAMNGAVKPQILRGNGRITVNELTDGDVIVNADTVSLSVIHLEGGLDDDGSVVVNDSRGNFDHNGTIYVGDLTEPRP